MTPREVFLRLVHGVADGDLEALPALYAEQTDVRHPMSPYGDQPLLSREALRKHFRGAGPRVAGGWCGTSRTTSGSTRLRTRR